MNILFVCTGNTCRSPLAEGYLKSKNISGINVLSAGFGAADIPVSVGSEMAMKKIGIDIGSHLSRTISSGLIDWADKIFCMSLSHIDMLLSMGAAKEKVFLLGHGIADPFMSDLSVYEDCRDEIIREIDLLFPLITVRKSYMSALDAEHIAELEKLCFSSPWSYDALKQSYQNGTTFFIAELNGEFAGYIGLNTVLDEGYITNIAVMPPFRKKGVAKALLKHTEDFAKSKKLAFISLEVRPTNAHALSLYSSFGFSEEGRRKNFYQNPTEDALILTKRF